MPRGRTFFLILRSYLIRERLGLAQLLSLHMCFGQNTKEKLSCKRSFTYSLGCLFSSHSVITSNTVFVSLLLASSVPIISVEIHATGCFLVLLNKSLVQKGSSKSPSNIHSQWWDCISTPGADCLDPAYLFLHI